MNFSDFQKMSMRTIPKQTPHKDLLANFALGMIGEAAEVTEPIKKFVYHGHDLDLPNIKKEIGDVLFYLAGLATLTGLDLGDIAKANIEKLKARYPDGFDSLKSVNREA
jgi:NTP pyrophosphatase (non-canonical NTP hydrolase)